MLETNPGASEEELLKEKITEARILARRKFSTFKISFFIE